MPFAVSRRASQRGRTLIELVIASGMLLLLLASCTVALRSAMQYHRRIGEQTDLENSLMVAVNMIGRDVAETAPQAVGYEGAPPEGPALTFPLPRSMAGHLLIDHAAGNRLLFGTVVSYRVMGPERELRRYVDPLPTPVRQPPHPIDDMAPPHNLAFYDVPGKGYKAIAKGVVDFTLTGIDIADYGSAKTVTTDLATAEILQLELKLERQMSRKYAVSMVLDLVPKN